MTTETLTRRDPGALMEQVIIQGDLGKLQPAERIQYYQQVCASMGLNPLTKPFEYLHLNGKLILYARRDATDQLRKLHRVSILITARDRDGDVYAVTARATDAHGRTDESLGVVATQGLKGEALANAFMKAETKAKRRVTLSICGLGMLDESEVETIPAAELTVVSPKAVASAPVKRPDPPPDEKYHDYTTEPPPAPFEEWLEAFEKPDTVKALEALWRGVTMPELWNGWTATQQVELTAAKNRAKARLGAA